MSKTKQEFATRKEIAQAISEIAAGLAETASDTAAIYGVNIDTTTLRMHPYCWCEEEDCPWCMGCTCPPSAWTHLKNGKPMNAREWQKEFEAFVGEFPMTGTRKQIKDWDKRIEQRNAIYRQIHTPKCDYCRGTGPLATIHGGEAAKGAPNFWHKESNIKVWWYKYIGRGQTTNRPITLVELNNLITSCLKNKSQDSVL